MHVIEHLYRIWRDTFSFQMRFFNYSYAVHIMQMDLFSFANSSKQFLHYYEIDVYAYRMQ